MRYWNSSFRGRRVTLVLVGILVLVLGGASVAGAQGLVQQDGRINQVHHFGGDALYCVDANMNPTTQYSDFGAGGFRLLDEDGQELWFVPAADIAAAVALAKTSGAGVIVAEGRGTYGPTVIWTYVTPAGDDYFVFTGYDEHGKPNSVEFKFCNPVGPIPEPEPEVELCTLLEGFGLITIIVPIDPPDLDKRAADDFKQPKGLTRERTIPCDECPPSLIRVDAKALALKPSQPSGTGNGEAWFPIGCLEDLPGLIPYL